jgi:pyruvate dehydrogenase E1 component beta subunit
MMSYGQAIREALDTAMRLDDTVFLAGEGVGVSIHDDPNSATHGLLEKFGPNRVKDTPVSEAAIAGLAVGASAMGLRPVVEIMFFPFITLASDMLINHAAKLRYMSGGKATFPLTVRVKSGTGFSAGSQHSHHLEAWLAHGPGLKVVYPSTPADAKGLLLSAIFDDHPVVVVDEMPLMWTRGEVPEGDTRVPLGRAVVINEGSDCTIAGYGRAVTKATEAHEMLEKRGISAEVLDVRTLVPLDKETLLESVGKTGRLVIVHDATAFCGYGAELAATVSEALFKELKAPVLRVAAPDIPVPVSPPQERFYLPSSWNIVDAVTSLMEQ